MQAPTISYLTGIHFARGAIKVLPQVLADLGVRRPLLVTDTGVEQAGLLERLEIEFAGVFRDVQTNPDEESAIAGAKLFGELECDGVVAVGGGSPIDCAKCIALLATHAPPLESYALIRGGLERITGKKPPLVAVPTTAGTGSEVGRAALVTLASGSKLALVSPHMIPEAAICDPELTLGLPPRLTAATGMDAISHCVETFSSPKFNPVAEAIALDGLERAWKNLRRAVEHNQDIDARSELMMAALEGGLTFQKGLGLIHSLSHPLGSLTDKRPHHGMLNAIFLPHVLRFNAATCPQKMQRMAGAVGSGNDGESLACAAEDLVRAIGLPTRLSELGLSVADLDGIAAAALEDHSTPSNPRQVTLDDAAQILEAAL